MTSAPGTAELSASFAGNDALGARRGTGPVTVTVGKRTAAIALAAGAHGTVTATLSDATAGAGSVGVPGRSVFVAARDGNGSLLAVLPLTTSALGTATVPAASVPALARSSVAYFGSVSTPTPGGGTFDATDPTCGSAVSTALGFAPDHLGVTGPRTGPRHVRGDPVDRAHQQRQRERRIVHGRAVHRHLGGHLHGHRPVCRSLGHTLLTVGAAAAATVTAMSGTPQTAVAGSAFGAPLVATVQDAYRNPVSGVAVTFTIPAAGATTGGATFPGSALTATVNTGANGTATSPRVTAGTQTGPVTVSATIAATPVAATYELDVTSTTTGSKADLAVALSVPSSAVVGSNVQTRLTVTDNGPAATGKLGALLVIPRGWTASRTKGLTAIGAGALAATPDSNYRNNVALALVVLRAS